MSTRIRFFFLWVDLSWRLVQDWRSGWHSWHLVTMIDRSTIDERRLVSLEILTWKSNQQLLEFEDAIRYVSFPSTDWRLDPRKHDLRVCSKIFFMYWNSGNCLESPCELSCYHGCAQFQSGQCHLLDGSNAWLGVQKPYLNVVLLINGSEIDSISLLKSIAETMKINAYIVFDGNLPRNLIVVKNFQLVEQAQPFRLKVQRYSFIPN